MSRWTTPAACAASSASATRRGSSIASSTAIGPGDDEVAQRARDQPGGDVELAVDLAHAVDRDDVRVVERGEQLALAPEALAVDGIDGDVVTQHLQRDRASRDAVDREVHDAHAPHPDDPLDPVVTEHWPVHSEIGLSVPARAAVRKSLLDRKFGVDLRPMSSRYACRARMPEIALEPRPGDSVGPYRITRAIGRGRMGIVFEGIADGGEPGGRQGRHDRALAGRGLPAALPREVEAAQKIQHPNVVPVLGARRGGRPALPRPGADPGRLAGTTASWPRASSDLATTLAAAAAAPRRGIDALHAGGLVHRDIKPAQHPARRRPRLRLGLRPGQGQPGLEPHAARARRWARWTTWRPSRSAARTSARRPTSTRSAA